MRVLLRNTFFTKEGALLLRGEHEIPDGTALPRTAKVIEGKNTAKKAGMSLSKKE